MGLRISHPVIFVQYEPDIALDPILFNSNEGYPGEQSE